MANFRSFTLYNNDKTDKIDLNDLNGYIVSSPTGLGIYLDNSYFNVGSKRILTGQRLAFKALTMVIDIIARTRTDVEQKYAAVRDFIARNRRGGFKLAYSPYAEARERYIDCDIKAFDKTEKTTSRYMAIPLTVEPRTFWRVDEEKSSTAKDDTDANEWSFSLDEALDGLTGYDFLMNEQTGETELDVFGYDKSKLPQGLAADFLVHNINTGTNYSVRVGYDDFVLRDGVAYFEKTFATENFFSSVFRSKAYMKFEPSENSVKFGVLVENTAQSELDLGDYTTELIAGAEDYILKVNFSDSVKDDKCFITGFYEEKNGARRQVNGTKERGGSVAYIKLANFGRMLNATYTKEVVVLVRTIQDIPVDQLFTCSISGSLYTGSTAYAEGFLQETDLIGTDYEYNIAMASGAASVNSVTNDGDNEIPLKVRVFGAAVNPVIRLFKRGSGDPIQTVKINFSIPAGAYIEIDSDAENTGAWIVYQSGIVNNAITLLDQTTNMFLTLPRGEYDIRVADDNNNVVATTVFFRKEYLGA